MTFAPAFPFGARVSPAARLGLALGLLLATCVALIGAARAESAIKPGPWSGELRLSGSSTMGDRLARNLLIAFGAQARLTSVREELSLSPAETTLVLRALEINRALRAEVRAYGTTAGFADLAAGRADVGMASRPANDADGRAMASTHPGAETAVSVDGLAVIVHRDNPVVALTAAQLRDLMSGVVTNWSAVGGPDRPVTVYAGDDRSGLSDLLRRKNAPEAALAASAMVVGAEADLADAVAADRGGIGLVGVAYTRNARAVAIARECGLPAIAPTSFDLKTGEYPLSRHLYLYTGERRAPLADEFVRFAVSPAARAAIAHAGFAGLEPSLSPTPFTEAAGPASLPPQAATQGLALREALRGAHRVSVTIRFELGRSSLDPRSAADLAQLRLWAQQTAQVRPLILVGHSSADGEYEANVTLSRQRAREVESRLRVLGVPVAASLGVGPIRPVACETSVEAANLNRRVEVWVR